ncbi:HpcH/HpaI aldolase family protein [Rhodococcus opacus]|nr:aldolase/citrate lyase family protein [Rhodococcus opacus]
MSINPGRITRKLREGQRVYGVAIQIPSPELVEISGAAGYDYAWIDAEHGAFSLSEVRDLIRAADAVGMDSIVRVPDHNPSFIQRVLDTGAAGIMVPHLRTAREAKDIVAAATFSPSGIRGACPFIRAANHASFNWHADYQALDRAVIVLGLIEDLEGVDNVEAIAAVDGLTGLLFGPFDLGMAMGLHGDVSDAQIRAQHDRVVTACSASGIEYVTASIDWEFGAFPSTGSRLVTAISDKTAILSTFRNGLENARAMAAAESAHPAQAPSSIASVATTT